MTLAARNLTINRGGRAIVRSVDLDLNSGEMVALVGPNGAGKSTLLRSIAGEISPDIGRTTLNGRDLAEFSARELARERAVMAQATSIVFDFTVAEILDLGWIQSQFRTVDERDLATGQVAVACHIAHLLDRTFNTLSGGEKQRVQFARCLLQVWQPVTQMEERFLLLDEPTSSLDLAHELMVLRLAGEQSRRNAGVLVVLHDLNLAARFCDRVVVLFEGEIVDSGDPTKVLEDDLLSDIYATDIQVEWHSELQRVIVHT